MLSATHRDSKSARTGEVRDPVDPPGGLQCVVERDVAGGGDGHRADRQGGGGDRPYPGGADRPVPPRHPRHGAPMKVARKSGFTMATFICCIACTKVRSSTRAGASRPSPT